MICGDCGISHAFAIVFRGDFLPLPVHASRALVIDLHAIHTDVALACLWIARDHARKRDEPSCIFWPALQDGKIEQRKIIALDHFFTRAGCDGLGKKLAHLREQRQHFHFVQKALRRFHVHEGAYAIGDFVEAIYFEREPHAAR